ncbi:PP2C family protein-serine/threonine phosphatase [Dinoroseobacter sp. S124A]|uniref:PP2C family protein-serine/threonine phosphatase n=1 Tax=Dinoroseobacter sp. S124A TaxID=3415128 RepID=UPI003C7ACB4A
MIPEPTDDLPPHDTTAGALHVLVVDDSRLQRRILSMALKKKGYVVFEAEDGNHGLEVFQDNRIDIVISDWMMPGLSGPEMCRALRDLNCDHYVYIILLTTKTEKNEIAEGFDAGADDFLSKPVHTVELMARITAGERVMRMERELTNKNALISETLAELKTLYQAVDNDLIEAKKLQQSLVRDKIGTFRDAEIALMLQSSGHVGGDLVGFFRINSSEIGLYSLDVSGHGVSSALMTARLAGVLSGSVPGKNIAIEADPEGNPVGRDPGAVAADLNTLLLEEMDTEHYFTIILAILNSETGHIRLVQAGHPHAQLLRSGGSPELMGDGGLPIGLLDGAEYTSFETTLNAGDRILMVSDGFTECTDPDGNMLDDAGLSKWVAKHRDLDGPTLMEVLPRELDSFAQGADFGDDISGLVLDFGRVPQDA